MSILLAAFRYACAAALLLVSLPVWAVDGDLVSQAPAGREYGWPIVQKICDAKTTATDCGPIPTAMPNACHVTFRLYRANNAGALCTFDNWNLYVVNDTNTSADYNPNPIYTFDDDGTGGLTGVLTGTDLEWFGPVGPMIWVDAGTLGTCSNFTIVANYYACGPPR